MVGHIKIGPYPHNTLVSESYLYTSNYEVDISAISGEK